MLAGGWVVLQAQPMDSILFCLAAGEGAVAALGNGAVDIPEPSSLSLFTLGVLGVAVGRTFIKSRRDDGE